jgi:hypothetical protein
VIIDHADEEKQKYDLLTLVFFCLDPCARVNCNHGRCEVDRATAVCRCFQGYTGHDCLTPLGK